MPPRTSDSHPCSPSWRHDPPPDTGPRTLGASMATEPTPAPASGPEPVATVITGAVVVMMNAEREVFHHVALAVRDRPIGAIGPTARVNHRALRPAHSEVACVGQNGGHTDQT